MGWTVNGYKLGVVQAERVEWDAMELEIECTEWTYENVVSILGKHAGKTETVITSGGDFLSYDVSDGENTYVLEPPAERDDLRLVREYYVDDFSEETIDDENAEHRVTLTLVPARPYPHGFGSEYGSGFGTNWHQETADGGYGRSYGTDYGTGSGEWLFILYTGHIYSRWVGIEKNEGKDGGTESFDITIFLQRRQAKMMQQALTNLEGVSVRELPDQGNISQDESPASRATIRIRPPTEEWLEGGQYRIDDFSEVWLHDDLYRFKLTLLEAYEGFGGSLFGTSFGE